MAQRNFQMEFVCSDKAISKFLYRVSNLALLDTKTVKLFVVTSGAMNNDDLLCFFADTLLNTFLNLK